MLLAGKSDPTKGSTLPLAEIGERRMSLYMKQNKARNPTDISLLGAQAKCLTRQ
jgi:hypothetical protein